MNLIFEELSCAILFSDLKVPDFRHEQVESVRSSEVCSKMDALLLKCKENRQ